MNQHQRFHFYGVLLMAVFIVAGHGLGQSTEPLTGDAGFRRSSPSFNPDVSAIVDVYYQNDDADEGIGHILENMAGFGPAHGGEAHTHSGVEKGFNLRHLELQFSADVDPYVKGSAIAAIDL